MTQRIRLCLSATLVLLASGLALTADSATTPTGTPAQVEFRLLGGGGPVLFIVDEVNEHRAGKSQTVSGSDEAYFTGMVVSLTPHLDESGDIAYRGSLTRYVLLDLETQPDGKLSPVISREQVEVEGSLQNHAATAVRFPEQAHTVYFALSDPARPKEDCAACGPEAKDGLANSKSN